MKKEERDYKWVYIVTLLCTFFLLLLSTVINNFDRNNKHNEAVMYCELANINVEISNEMMPYFERYLDESIETISEVNSTAGKLLELSMIKARGLEIPELDCPKPKCKGLFVSSLGRGYCELIKEAQDK